MPRTFIALRPSDDVLDHIDAVVNRARRAMVGPRWTSRDQWHLTLHFFGDLDAEQTAAAAGAMAKLATCTPFAARFDQAGAFPNPSRARVLWLASAEGNTSCASLASVVAVVLAGAGFAIGDDRQFRPHVTVARLRVPSPAQAGVSALRDALLDGGEGPVWTVNEAVLYESRLHREGAAYSVLERVTFAG